MRATGSIQNIMETTLETIKGSIDANTIIGDPIKTDTTVVVPISKVTIGFGIGGGEYSKGYKEEVNTDKNDTNFAGGSAGAVSIQPVAFVVVEDGETRLMSLDNNINMIDNILFKLKDLINYKIEIENKQIEKLRNIKLEYEKDLEAYEQKSLNEKSVKELMEYELSYLKDVTGESKVIGDGIIITIKDSENDLKENQNPNELIVHDIDILRIVNDLKKAGAIAISINGERLLTLSKIKCSGSTIKVNDTTYGQPFIIKAIGDLNTLKASVTSPQSYTNILQEVYGIYIKVEEENDIIINSFKKYE